MFSITSAFLLLLVYILCLYLIARWGMSNSTTAQKAKRSATTYSLSLAVYCTSWTFYGNVGQASEQGINHVALYLGSTLSFILLTPILKNMVRIKNAYHSTSIADFISTRYNQSALLAAIISILCLVGITPYISIQLKSVITTFQLLVDNSNDESNVFLSQLDIITVMMMAIFTIVFGVRRLDPTERHPGMMVALAGESILKLLAFLSAAVLICFFIFDGIGDIFQQALQQEQASGSFSVFTHPPAISSWFTSMLLGAIGVIALPRQFHVGVVECSDEKLIDKARWQFPLYLFAINLFVFPIAMAGKILLPEAGSADLLLLEIPVSQQQHTIAALVYLGGFAASTGMIMISAMTLSTMATNHLVLPVIEQLPSLGFLRRKLLFVRWFVVVFILFLSLFYFRTLGESELIVKIGSISFVAVAQLIPALIGGMLWKKGNLNGAMAAIIGGTIIWFYSLMLPSIIRSGLIETELLSQGLFGLSWLRPEQLFGLQISSIIGHSLFWSMLVNIGLYILVSDTFRETDKEQQEKSLEFILLGKGQEKSYLALANLDSNISSSEKFDKIIDVVSRYLPSQTAHNKLVHCFEECKFESEQINILQLAKLRSRVTSLLAGLIGMALANKAIHAIDLLNKSEQNLLATCYSDILSKAQLSPDELLEKVDFYQEKQTLLENHAQLQEQAIVELKQEQDQTLQAKYELKELNEKLEIRVQDRTQQLTIANDDLTDAMLKLKRTQNKLLEADKMASLGGLVTGIAHEINTPVGIVLTAISNLQEEHRKIETLFKQNKVTKANMESFLLISAESCSLSLINIERAAELVSSFKQVAVDQTSEECRSFLLADYLQTSLWSLRARLKENKHKIEIECDDDLFIISYPGAISQIMSNLITNSLIHAYDSDQQGLIKIVIEQQENTLHIKYRDDGRGLSPEGMDKIFEPFYTTKRGSGGSGLGAHIVYNLVTQRLKGEISVDKSLAKGLGFNIYIPVDVS